MPNDKEITDLVVVYEANIVLVDDATGPHFQKQLSRQNYPTD